MDLSWMSSDKRIDVLDHSVNLTSLRTECTRTSMCCIPHIMPHPYEAVQYAELKPVECESFADAVALREKQATEILTQVGVLYCTLQDDGLHGGFSHLRQINGAGRKWKWERGCQTGWWLNLEFCG